MRKMGETWNNVHLNLIKKHWRFTNRTCQPTLLNDLQLESNWLTKDYCFHRLN